MLLECFEEADLPEKAKELWVGNQNPGELLPLHQREHHNVTGQSNCSGPLLTAQDYPGSFKDNWHRSSTASVHPGLSASR